MPSFVAARRIPPLVWLKVSRIKRYSCASIGDNSRSIGDASGVAATAAVVAIQLPRCLDYARQFGNDSRDRLRLWVMRNAPADAVIVQDGCVMLDEPFPPRTGITDRPQFLLYGPAAYDNSPAASAGPLKDLRRMGVQYVAVSDFAYYRYFDPSVRPTADAVAVFESRRRWYEALFRDHELVWSSVPEHPTYSHFNNPELRL